MKCDLHGFRLLEAIEEVVIKIEDCLLLKDNLLFVIHGYKHGQILKKYFRSKKFLKDMKKAGYFLKKLSPPNPGVSVFQIT